MKIATKISLLALFLVLLCSGLLFFLVNLETKKTLEDEIKFKLARESKYAISNTDRFIYERLKDIKNLAQDAVLSNDTSSTKQILKRLQSFKKQNKLYVSISFFNADRYRIADTEEKSVGTQHSYKNYWVKTAQEDAVLDISYSESLKSVVMHFAAVVYNAKGKRIGLVVSRVLIHSLYEVFSEVIENEKMPTMYVALLDTNGTLLYSNRKQDSILVDKHPNYNLLAQYFTPTVQLQTPEINQNSQDDSHYFEHDKQIFFYQKQQGYLSYAGHEWYLVMKLPRATAFAKAQKLRQKIYYAVIPVAILSVILAILFGRYFSKPIVQLSRAAKVWGSGHLQTTFALTSHKNDEIGLLSNHMLAMAQQLAKKMQEQDELNYELQATNEILQDLNLDLERKNQNITASIHYAERIQSAMLPDKEVIRTIFPEFFILFKPKHIVSGDFYWFQEIEIAIPVREEGQMIQLAESKYWVQKGSHASLQDLAIKKKNIPVIEQVMQKVYCLAVGDCTGHGVPGALMSMIGNNLLYQIVIHAKITSPDLILTQLHEGVKKVLKQDENNNKDGMDIAFCLINPTQKYIEFAGVHRPLILFSEDNMTEIKGNKLSIGGNFMADKWKVEKHYLTYKPNDTLYLFTDGYGDQFCGTEGPKKYTGKRLKQTLQMLQNQPFEEQFAILEIEHITWKNNLAQTDDILVVGLRLV